VDHREVCGRGSTHARVRERELGGKLRASAGLSAVPVGATVTEDGGLGYLSAADRGELSLGSVRRVGRVAVGREAEGGERVVAVEMERYLVTLPSRTCKTAAPFGRISPTLSPLCLRAR
jgi:hypothetical protein